MRTETLQKGERMKLEFTTKEFAAILSVGQEKPVPDQRIRTWSRPGNLLGDPKRPRGTGETRGGRELIFTLGDLLVGFICLTLEDGMKRAHNSVAAWMAGIIADRINDTPWTSIPEDVPINLTDQLTVNVRVREFLDALKHKVALWLVQTGRVR